MSWEIGAIFVSLACVLLSYPILKIHHYGFRIVAVLAAPYLSAQALYWGVSSVKGASDEVGSWSGLFVGTWAAVGLIALLVGLYVSRQF
ncbi:MAG: hypothetical protein KDA57_23550, partial [Planctomycetales bacterium]|nr:hypothetical protein [Planctomycetales bacterium]